MTDEMLWAVEQIAVLEDLSNVRHKVIGCAVARGQQVGRRLVGARVLKLDLNGGEIHGALDDDGIVGDVERNRINGTQKGGSVLEALEGAHGRKAKLVLVERHGRRPGVRGRRGVLEGSVRSERHGDSLHGVSQAMASA